MSTILPSLVLLMVLYWIYKPVWDAHSEARRGKKQWPKSK